MLGPRQQGDIGEGSAVEWLTSRGYPIFLPVGHSPDYDLVAEIDKQLVRVQVKTSRALLPLGRYQVSLATRGGNRSWNGTVKRFDRSRYDQLFVLLANGRRWFIPADRIEGTTALHLGGPKYAEFEIDRGRPFASPVQVAR